jgi:hypothetical protein
MFQFSHDFDEVSCKGFHMTFANGWTVSVQIGGGNYCDNRAAKYGTVVHNSRTAEVWAWDKLGHFEEDPRGFLTMDEVLAYMNEVAAMPKRERAEGGDL